MKTEIDETEVNEYRARKPENQPLGRIIPINEEPPTAKPKTFLGYTLRNWILWLLGAIAGVLLVIPVLLQFVHRFIRPLW